MATDTNIYAYKECQSKKKELILPTIITKRIFIAIIPFNKIYKTLLYSI